MSRVILLYTGPKWAVLCQNGVVLVGAWQKCPANPCVRRARDVRYKVYFRTSFCRLECSTQLQTINRSNRCLRWYTSLPQSCDTKHLCRIHGEVQRWRYKLIVPGHMGAREIIGRAVISSQSAFLIANWKQIVTYRFSSPTDKKLTSIFLGPDDGASSCLTDSLAATLLLAPSSRLQVSYVEGIVKLLSYPCS
jgi:hypothetical protein